MVAFGQGRWVDRVFPKPRIWSWQFKIVCQPMEMVKLPSVDDGGWRVEGCSTFFNIRGKNAVLPEGVQSWILPENYRVW